MILQKTKIDGVYTIDLDVKKDERGFFSRLFCADMYEKLGLEPACVQINTSFSSKKGTLRGMHYQIKPSEETKIIRCTKGALYDVVLDLRADSLTFGQSVSAELTPENHKMMYVPRGCAHGFFTLEPNTEILYVVSAFYDRASEKGVRWDDPTFQIPWPSAPTILSDKDRSYPDFDLPS